MLGKPVVKCERLVTAGIRELESLSVATSLVPLSKHLSSLAPIWLHMDSY